MTAISLRDVSKAYRIYARPTDRLKEVLLRGRTYHQDFWALREISLEVPTGTTFGIIGQNGSGKSTLLQIMAGIVRPSSGAVQVNGRVAALLELGAGFNSEFTGRENVFINGSILGFSRQEMERRFEAIARFAEIGPFIEQPVKTYSSGMVLRLAFAVAANVDPDILLIDEHLSVGDTMFQRRCFQRMEEFQKRGKTIVLVSHDIGLARNFCQRVILLDRGRVVQGGNPLTVANIYEELVCRREDEYLRWLRGESPEGGTPGWSGDELASMAPADDPDPLEEVTEYRYGTRDAEITRIELLNQERMPTVVAETGKQYIAALTIRFHQRIEQPFVGMNIDTIRGVKVCGLNSRHMNIDLGPQEAGGTLTVEFHHTMHLNPGTYFYSFGVQEWREGHVRPLDRRNGALRFRVVGGRHYIGLTTLAGTITHCAGEPQIG
jgi:lipopolysaccharide transport system ATP-binding protein